MNVSSRRPWLRRVAPRLWGRIAAGTAVYFVSFAALLAAQVEEQPPFVRGTVVQGGEPLAEQPVTLHRVSSESAGELEVALTDQAGGFAIQLPGVPGGTEDVFFVSTRYHGILYFGAAVTDAASADSIHTLEVYDTLSAAPGGHPFPVANRTLLLEVQPEGWRVTDLFEIENTSDRTVIAGQDGATWSYPLMTGATNVELGDSDLGPDSWAFDAGRVRTSAPVPPGTRLYMFGYDVPELGSLTLPGATTHMEVLVHESAPAFGIAGLTPDQPVELESGRIFRRHVANDLLETIVTVTEPERDRGLPLEGMMVALGLALGLLGVWAATRTKPVPVAQERPDVLRKIAELDEEYAAIPQPSKKEAQRYRRLREALLARLSNPGE